MDDWWRDLDNTAEPGVPWNHELLPEPSRPVPEPSPTPVPVPAPDSQPEPTDDTALRILLTALLSS